VFINGQQTVQNGEFVSDVRAGEVICN